MTHLALNDMSSILGATVNSFELMAIVVTCQYDTYSKYWQSGLDAHGETTLQAAGLDAS